MCGLTGYNHRAGGWCSSQESLRLWCVGNKWVGRDNCKSRKGETCISNHLSMQLSIYSWCITGKLSAAHFPNLSWLFVYARAVKSWQNAFRVLNKHCLLNNLVMTLCWKICCELIPHPSVTVCHFPSPVEECSFPVPIINIKYIFIFTYSG